jgi:hypothetical protein
VVCVKIGIAEEERADAAGSAEGEEEERDVGTHWMTTSHECNEMKICILFYFLLCVDRIL